MDAFMQLDKVASKRSALEKLIAIAIGIQSQQQAMEDLSLIAKPSQDLPAKMVQHLEQFETKYADLSDEELRSQLESIESEIHALINQVIRFAQLEVSALRDEEIKGLSVTGFKHLVENFEKRTQRSLILRFLLKKRGVVLVAFKLPFPQDSVAERIQALRERESHCIAQIKAEAQSIIDDTQLLLAGASFPEKMRQQLQSVQAAMQDNLQHLDQGGTVATLPNKFEVIVSQPEHAAQEVEPQQAEPLQAEPPQPSPPTPEKKKPVKGSERSVSGDPKQAGGHKKLSLLQLLLKWLSTPWSTSWRSLKEENDKEAP